MTGYQSKKAAAQDKLAQPAQEPVASCNGMPAYEGPLSKALTQDLDAPLTITGVALCPQPKVRTGDCLLVGVCASEGHKIQAQRPWVGLTDEELAELSASGLALWALWRAIEAKLKEKNT